VFYELNPIKVSIFFEPFDFIWLAFVLEVGIFILSGSCNLLCLNHKGRVKGYNGLRTCLLIWLMS